MEPGNLFIKLKKYNSTSDDDHDKISLWKVPLVFDKFFDKFYIRVVLEPQVLNDYYRLKCITTHCVMVLIV